VKESDSSPLRNANYEKRIKDTQKSKKNENLLFFLVTNVIGATLFIIWFLIYALFVRNLFKTCYEYVLLGKALQLNVRKSRTCVGMFTTRLLTDMPGIKTTECGLASTGIYVTQTENADCL